MVIIPGGIAKQCRQFVAQIRAQGGDVVAAVQNAVVVRMKKQKLQLKDEMLKILQQESVKEV